MSQCVPNWDLDDVVPSRFDHRPNHSGPDVPTSNYEVAELTWENGQLSMHGLGMRRVPSKHNLSSTQNHKYATGTLESLVNIATQKPPPCNGVVGSACMVASSTRVDSCSAAATREQKRRAVVEEGDEGSVLKKPNLAPRVPVMTELSKSVSTLGGDSWHVPTVDTCGDLGLTSTSFCSQGNTFSSNSDRPAGTNYTTTPDDRDSVCHSRLQRGTGKEEERKRGNVKSSSSTRRSRAAAVHNQSERKRRDKINQKMKLLQKMVPNSNKTDKASMLDEVIDYLKQLQAQVSMMSRMSIPSMMMPHQLAMQQQQQLQMSMMAMGMAMPAATMDININPAMAARQGVLNPTAAFIPVTATWDFAVPDRLPSQAPTDPISTYLASQPQSMPIEAYSRMIALIQHQQQLAAASKH